MTTSVLSIVSKTGGNPTLRKAISETISSVGVGGYLSFDKSVYWYMDMFNTMDVLSKSNVETPLNQLHKELNRFYNGNISEQELLESSDYYFRKQFQIKQIPNSSFMLVGANTKWTTKMIVTYAIYTCFVLFLTSSYHTRNSTNSATATIHGPNENRLIPVISKHTSTRIKNSVDNRANETSYINKNVLEKYSPALYTSYDENEKYKQDIITRRSEFLERANLLVDSPQFSLYSHDNTKFLDDSFNLNVIDQWVKYTLASIDPAYALSSAQKMNILVSEGGQHAGLYHVVSDNVFVNIDLPESVERGGRQLLHTVRTLVHELSHRVHLATEEILIDCNFDESDKGRLCISKPKKLHEHFYRNLHQVEEEVYTTVFLGVPSDNMTYTEAKHYLRLILDMKINEIYDHAKTSGLYKDFMGSYGISSAREFWAEASSEFLIQDFPHVQKTPMMFAFDRFASRDWIEKNDPKLFSLLKEVYSGSSVFSANMD